MSDTPRTDARSYDAADEHDTHPRMVVSAAFARNLEQECARLRTERDELRAMLGRCDSAFASWQCGQIPGRPEDILALTSALRALLAKTEQKG